MSQQSQAMCPPGDIYVPRRTGSDGTVYEWWCFFTPTFANDSHLAVYVEFVGMLIVAAMALGLTALYRGWIPSLRSKVSSHKYSGFSQLCVFLGILLNIGAWCLCSVVSPTTYQMSRGLDEPGYAAPAFMAWILLSFRGLLELVLTCGVFCCFSPSLRANALSFLSSSWGFGIYGYYSWSASHVPVVPKQRNVILAGLQLGTNLMLFGLLTFYLFLCWGNSEVHPAGFAFVAYARLMFFVLTRAVVVGFDAVALYRAFSTTLLPDDQEAHEDISGFPTTSMVKHLIQQQQQQDLPTGINMHGTSSVDATNSEQQAQTFLPTTTATSASSSSDGIILMPRYENFCSKGLMVFLTFVGWAFVSATFAGLVFQHKVPTYGGMAIFFVFLCGVSALLGQAFAKVHLAILDDPSSKKKRLLQVNVNRFLPFIRRFKRVLTPCMMCRPATISMGVEDFSVCVGIPGLVLELVQPERFNQALALRRAQDLDAMLLNEVFAGAQQQPLPQQYPNIPGQPYLQQQQGVIVAVQVVPPPQQYYQQQPAVTAVTAAAPPRPALPTTQVAPANTTVQ